jgi:hypothetical protein
MERMKISVAAAVLVALAIAMLGGVSAASASPTWHYCAKTKPKNTGNYTSSTCDTKSAPGEGPYEYYEGIGKGGGFKGKGGSLTVYIYGLGRMVCPSTTISGVPVAPNGVAKVELTLKKCKYGATPCDTEGGPLETIETEPLSGQLGWLSKSSNVAGLSLTSESSPGTGFIANFDCLGLAEFRWTGAFIAVIGPTKKVTKETELDYSVAEYFTGEALTNPPAFEEGTVGVLETEFNSSATGNKWSEPTRSGWEGNMESKGEALSIE